ncbi:MAG: NAD(P)/FAD-dependent oxidoreductase, partial [Candidatus Kariarchaeaceae archaeon]|jgi:flavin-dependent dehydrogenase
VKVTGGGQIPIRPPFDCLTFNGGVLIGDAACMVDPTTAEGHGPALVTGYYAGKALSNAIEQKKYQRESLWQYNTDAIGHYGRRNAISYVTLQFLREINPEGMDFILKRRVLTENELLAVFDGEDPETGLITVLLKIIRCFPRYGLLMKLRELVKAVKSMGSIYDTYPDNPTELAQWREKRNAALGEDL